MMIAVAGGLLGLFIASRLLKIAEADQAAEMLLRRLRRRKAV
jgi:hypothetical protein